MAGNENVQNTRRIAKNTLLLYVRTFFVLLVNLYTPRVVLDVLGEEDFGVYNIVGGIVVMFSIISVSLSNAITRYLTFELGNRDEKKLNLIFSTSVNIQLLISLVVTILAESVGVWFLFERMQIPPERLNAAFWVLQCSLLTFVIQLVSLPYNAVIIAHEKMDIFAYVSVLEAALRLLAAYAMFVSPLDKLVV